jgi:hypothetical protein
MWKSQLAPERSVLQTGEERVQLLQRGAMLRLQPIDGGDPAGELALEWKRRNWYL